MVRPLLTPKETRRDPGDSGELIKEDPRRLQVGGVEALGEPPYTQSAQAALQLMGVNRENGLAADCNLARPGDRSLMEEAGLTIVVQRA